MATFNDYYRIGGSTTAQKWCVGNSDSQWLLSSKNLSSILNYYKKAGGYAGVDGTYIPQYSTDSGGYPAVTCKFIEPVSMPQYRKSGVIPVGISKYSVPHHQRYVFYTTGTYLVKFENGYITINNNNQWYVGTNVDSAVIFVILQGGGGGGAGGGTSTGKGGGGGASGGTIGMNIRLRNYTKYMTDGTKGAAGITITVGGAGSAGAAKSSGGAGGDTSLTVEMAEGLPPTSWSCYARGGAAGVNGTSGTSQSANSVPTLPTIVSDYAVEIKKNQIGQRGLGQGTQAPQYSMDYANMPLGLFYATVIYNNVSFTRYSGAPVSANSGGGGGCSMFGNGADATSTTGQAPSSTAYGAGGSGGGYHLISPRVGGEGATGCVYIFRPFLDN